MSRVQRADFTRSRSLLRTYWPLKSDGSLTSKRKLKTDWSAYATSYDLLAEYNPAYQQLLNEFEKALLKIEAPRLIYDIGGGTGNYSEIAARRCPESSVHLVEPDLGMISRAKEKLSAYNNITYIDSALQEFEPSAKADLVICVHALYAMPAPKDRIADLRRLLRPGGTLFLVDIGRTLNVADWRSYFFSHLSREVGIAKALWIFWRGREIAKHNKSIIKAQKEKLYWTHTGSEIAGVVENAGFEIVEQKPIYRDYSDLLVCLAA